MSWTLSPDNSPTTTITANQASRRCGAPEAEQTECALACRASQRSGCPGLPTFEGCVGFCLENTNFIRDALPECLTQNTAINSCTAAVAATPASNWECFEPFGAFALGPCAAEYDATNLCLSGG